MLDRTSRARPVATSSLVRGILDALKLLTPRERARSYWLIASMTVNALLGVIGLAGIFPFVQLMLDDKSMQAPGLTVRTLKWLGAADSSTALTVLGLAILVLIVSKNVYGLYHGILQNRFSARAEARLATEILDRLTRAPYEWIVTQNSNLLRDVVTGHTVAWSRGVVRPSLQLANDGLFVILIFSALIWFSPLSGLIATLAAGGLAGALMSYSKPRISIFASRKRRASNQSSVAAAEAISGGRDVRMSAIGPMLVHTFQKSMSMYSMSDASVRKWQQIPRAGIEIIAFGALIGIALIALQAGKEQAEVAGLLALYCVMAVRALPIMTQFVATVAMIADSLPAVEEIRGILRSLPPPIDDSKIITSQPWAKVELKQVEFAYEGGDRILGPLDFELCRGKRVGIVGLSGAGKSTLVDVLVGLLPPKKGEVRVDGVLIDNCNRADWIRRISYVPQTPFMMDATLRENITFGSAKPVDYDAWMHAAIAGAGLSDVLLKLPQGLETPLGEAGVRLSGGQRQRVAIARALYRNAEVLVLDEATSALDSLTEREITDALDRLQGKITMLVVAHRLATVVRLDEIILMSKGMILARGTHDELLEKCEDYRRLVTAQSIPETSAESDA